MGRPIKKHPGGRPTKMTSEILKKLEEGFLMNLSDEQACLFAGISPRTLYNYQNKNDEFVQRKQLLRQQPKIDAKMKIAKEVKSDTATAKWLLERTEKETYGQNIKVGGDPENPLSFKLEIEYVDPDKESDED